MRVISVLRKLNTILEQEDKIIRVILHYGHNAEIMGVRSVDYRQSCLC
jgi:hypothetical protein